MVRRLIPIVVLVMTVVFAVPSFACSYECREGTDAEGNAFAHCVEYLSYCSQCFYSSCAEKTFCYRTADGFRYCTPYCDGPQCFIA